MGKESDVVVVNVILFYRGSIKKYVQSLPTTKLNGLLSHYEFRKAIALYWINDKEALNIYKSCVTTTAAASAAATFQLPTSISSMSIGDDYTITSSIGSAKRAPPVDGASLHENDKLK